MGEVRSFHGEKVVRTAEHAALSSAPERKLFQKVGDKTEEGAPSKLRLGGDFSRLNASLRRGRRQPVPGDAVHRDSISLFSLTRTFPKG
jgi:hypothetical protein